MRFRSKLSKRYKVTTDFSHNFEVVLNLFMKRLLTISLFVLITKISFGQNKSFSVNVEVNGSSVNIIEPVMMKPAVLTIGEVTVTGTRSEKQQNIEKTTINVAKNIASVSGNITDVLKGQPGINIDSEANVYIRGNKNILILSA